MRRALLLAALLVAVGLQAPSHAQAQEILLHVKGGAGNATLTWTSPLAGPASHWIYRGTSPDTLVFLTILGNVTRYVDESGLEPGRTYWWAVQAATYEGAEAWSSAVSARVATRPDAPRNLTVESSPKSLTLSWQPPADGGGSPIVRYLVYRGAPNGTLFYRATILNGTRFVDERPVYDVEFAVAAVNGMGVGERSAPARPPAAAPAPAPAPAPPPSPPANATPAAEEPFVPASPSPTLATPAPPSPAPTPPANRSNETSANATATAAPEAEPPRATRTRLQVLLPGPETGLALACVAAAALVLRRR